MMCHSTQQHRTRAWSAVCFSTLLCDLCSGAATSAHELADAAAAEGWALDVQEPCHIFCAPSSVPHLAAAYYCPGSAQSSSTQARGLRPHLQDVHPVDKHVCSIVTQHLQGQGLGLQPLQARGTEAEGCPARAIHTTAASLSFSCGCDKRLLFAGSKNKLRLHPQALEMPTRVADAGAARPTVTVTTVCGTMTQSCRFPAG